MIQVRRVGESTFLCNLDISNLYTKTDFIIKCTFYKHKYNLDEEHKTSDKKIATLDELLLEIDYDSGIFL